MISLLGLAPNIKNIGLLSSRHIELSTIKTSNDLRAGFLKFLANHQPQTAPATSPTDVFVRDATRSETLKNAYRISSLNDRNQNDFIKDQIEGLALDQLITQTKAGWDYLRERNPQVALLLDLVIHSIFFRKTGISTDGKQSFGGSSSTAIGAIWVSGLKNLLPCDTAEFLLHELTHHLIFIDERCRSQFVYSEMIKPENYAQSAILNKKRPLDKVVHSILVATEIILARRSFLSEPGLNVHPETDVLQQQTLASIDDVMALPKRNAVLTDWTVDLLLKAKSTLVYRQEAIA